MAGTFIISFDCEGKWGVADHLNDRLRVALTNKNLNRAYRKLIEILDSWQIKASFAFVGAFTMSVEEYQAQRELFTEVYVNGKSWLQPFKQEVARQQYEGWLNPQPFQTVVSETQHEIAAHGFSHCPLAETLISREDFNYEIECLKRVAAFRGREAMTFIYPRNLIGYPEELRRMGFTGYRDGLRESPVNKLDKAYQKIRNLAQEFQVYEQAQTHAKPGGFITIPPGVFLNWRDGLRAAIPLSVTIQRWQHLINDAIKHQRVVHLYSHPHNFITGQDMYFLLEKVLKMVSEALRRQEMVNVTQKEYVDLKRKGNNLRDG